MDEILEKESELDRRLFRYWEGVTCIVRWKARLNVV